MPASPPRPRVALLYEIPAPYRLPFFERLAREEAFDLEVLFQNRHQVDREWDLQDTLPFPHRFLPVRQIVFRGKDFFTYLINPGIWRVFREGRYDVVVVGSYIHQSSLAAILRCWLTRTPYLLMCESHLGTPRAWWKRWLKALAIRPIISRAAAWLPNGTAAKAYLTAYGARPERIFFSPNTIDVPTFPRMASRTAGLS